MKKKKIKYNFDEILNNTAPTNPNNNNNSIEKKKY